MSFENNVQNWVKLDNQIKYLNEKMKPIREEKRKLENDLIMVANEKRLNNKVINITDGSLTFNETKTSSPLTFKYVEECLHTIIPNEEHVSKIMDYIKTSRQVEEKLSIKRVQNK
tara:strand:- start:107 stop:451 length:345 start_codon:yes stop_codon:yes gene_type:complete